MSALLEGQNLAFDCLTRAALAAMEKPRLLAWIDLSFPSTVKRGGNN
jgi:hypothetical protein